MQFSVEKRSYPSISVRKCRVKSIARTLGVNHEVLRMWIKQYEYHGEKAFEKSYTAYSVPFKLDVLHYMNENGTSPN
ncbi:transposase [Paenibacillus solisilvae]|uniref:Transposase n=1 Tax=Paenibacillus solisilvae TaxID=2486751 RepID=A0ABW0VZX8_9BACL